MPPSEELNSLAAMFLLAFVPKEKQDAARESLVSLLYLAMDEARKTEKPIA